ncbi:MOSC domain-containing protein [Rhodocista pekingensis]|uniref:MOSC domain-containing protein n=1 Tax=Rhodocista pekingensis TaxID=201185 RepID=A0ABW2KUT4_9PROT
MSQTSGPARIAAIHYYPVKGLSAQSLPAVTLAPGMGLPHDRRFAILHGASSYDPEDPVWRPKTNYLTLMRDEKLATLEARYDPETCMLVLNRAGKPVARGRIDTATGRLLIDQFLAAYMKGSAAPGPYKLIDSPPPAAGTPHGHMFSDIQDRAVSLINLASVHDLERVTQRPVNPLRFRGNLHLEGLEPWAEAAWVGRRVRVGTALLEVFKTITRCAATEVDPETGERDLPVVKSLQRGFGHVTCGIYARVLAGGTVTVGDTIGPVEA